MKLGWLAFREHAVALGLAVMTLWSMSCALCSPTCGASPLHTQHIFLYTATLFLILCIHEWGHWRVAHSFSLQPSCPYFVPAPTLTGTLGAWMWIDGNRLSRRALLYTGLSGPWYGAVAAVICSVIGLCLPIPTCMYSVAGTDAGVELRMGESILWGWMVSVCHIITGSSPTTDVLHPIAQAGWVGLLLTGLNLLPAWPLDGGYIVCALFPRHHRWIAFFTGVFLLLWSTFLLYAEPVQWLSAYTWIAWAALIFCGMCRSGPVLCYGSPLLSVRDRWSAVATFMLGLLTWTPVPLSFL